MDPKIIFFFSYFFLITYPQAHYLQSEKFNFLLYFASIISVRSALYEKREGSGARSKPLTNGSVSGRPKNMRKLRIRTPTLVKNEVFHEIISENVMFLLHICFISIIYTDLNRDKKFGEILIVKFKKF
jgi:hypothetical protein